MARHLLIRTDSGIENVVQETELLAEKSLHDVLTSHPELVPSDDLEMGPSVVVGRESGLETGYAVVLRDRSGQLCLVEVKKEGNPDTRRVVAQLLDYAAALWQMSAAAFERDVLHPFLRSTGTGDGDLPTWRDSPLRSSSRERRSRTARSSTTSPASWSRTLRAVSSGSSLRLRASRPASSK